MTPDLQKGTQLANRYTLVRKLGAGADTETWLATDRMTRASVALKILRSDRITADALREEWQLSIRLMHAHIVRVFEFHDDDDCVFYSLQFVAGSDANALSGAPLADMLPSTGLLADALRYAHSKGIVHRDIKAGNVLYDTNGAPYLTDFGAAARANEQASGGSLIAASPQSLAGAPAAPADDIFALGGLVYELVAGRSPYSSANTGDDIRNRVPPPLTSASGDAVPAQIQELVAAMLAKDATQRPDAAEVAKRLAAAGFAGAPAPARYFDAVVPIDDELIAATDTVRPSRPERVAAASVSVVSRPGISPRTLGISLAVLLAILLGVVFLLPGTVTDEATEPGGITAETATQPADEAADDEADAAAPQRDPRVIARSKTEDVLGTLLSKMETLESRAVQRWGGLRYRQAKEAYDQGDEAYLARDYETAQERYRAAIEIADPLLDEVDRVFASTLADAAAALDAANTIDALRLYELAVAISPSHAGALAGLDRARNLATVLSLVEQGIAFEKDLELEAARQNFERAVEIDPLWEPAQAGLARVNEAIRELEFAQRMTEGLMAINDGYYDAARAAFRMAQALKPGSPEPADGLLQVDQAVRLNSITALEQTAARQEKAEQWDDAIATYKSILEIDGNLEFADQGVRRAEQMAALHKQLEDYIAAPDELSAPATLQRATRLLVDITRMPEIGPRLADQRDELSRLLKRAATPLPVKLVSDNVTEVSVYKVGKLGSFSTRELNLRPGTYVAVGSRPGYRDVRLEFQVGPELEAEPIVVRCEEPI